MSVKAIISIIAAVYVILGIIASLLFLVRQYRDNELIDSDDIRIAFILFIMGVIGLFVFIGCNIAMWIKENQPVEEFLNFVSKKMTEWLDNFSKKDTDASK